MTHGPKVSLETNYASLKYRKLNSLIREMICVIEVVRCAMHLYDMYGGKR